MEKWSFYKQEILTNFMTQVIIKTDSEDQKHLLEEGSLTTAKINVSRRMLARSTKKRLDFSLHYNPNISVTIIEAKDKYHSDRAGIKNAKARFDLTQKYITVKIFNIGSYNGLDAIRSIFHCHIHLIPFRINDLKNQTGGVRSVIVRKENYNFYQ